MDRIALQILEDGCEQDGRAMRRLIATLRDRLAESTDGRWAAAATATNSRSGCGQSTRNRAKRIARLTALQQRSSG